MIRVEDVETAATFYARVFDLHRHWSGDGSIGFDFTGSDAEIVLHCDPNIPSSVEVYYLVDDVAAVVGRYVAEGYKVEVNPFDITTGNVR
jgi:predicted enzyme related to lactoylglutathione lyase